MKIDNFSYILKGAALAICGVLIAFFPNVITWLFYIVGCIIIAGSVIAFLGSLTGGDTGFMFIGALIGAGIGILIICLPHIIMINIPIIAGIIFGVMGIMRIMKARSDKTLPDKKTQNIVFAVILLVTALIFILNPFKVSTAIRIIIGLVMIALSAFNFYVAYAISQRNQTIQHDVIDVMGHTVDDDTKYLK